MSGVTLSLRLQWFARTRSPGHDPIIDSLVVSANTIAPGGTLSLSASAHNDDPKNPVACFWSASAAG